MNLDGEGKICVDTGCLSLTTCSFPCNPQPNRHNRLCKRRFGAPHGRGLSHRTRRGTQQGAGHPGRHHTFWQRRRPMDCSLAFAAVDLVKRPYFKIDLKLRGKKVEDMPTEDIVHFFESLATSFQAQTSTSTLSTAATTTTRQKPQSKPLPSRYAKQSQWTQEKAYKLQRSHVSGESSHL